MLRLRCEMKTRNLASRQQPSRSLCLFRRRSGSGHEQSSLGTLRRASLSGERGLERAQQRWTCNVLETATPEGLREFTAGAYVHQVLRNPNSEEVLMSTTTKRTLIAGLTMALAAVGAATANAANPARQRSSIAGTQQASDTALASDFDALDRNTTWKLTSKLKLNFPTFHTEGIVFAGDRIFLSAVQIIEPTIKYPTPQGGYDRTPGKGIGHLFVMDHKGNDDRTHRSQAL